MLRSQRARSIYFSDEIRDYTLKYWRGNTTGRERDNQILFSWNERLQMLSNPPLSLSLSLSLSSLRVLSLVSFLRICGAHKIIILEYVRRRTKAGKHFLEHDLKGKKFLRIVTTERGRLPNRCQTFCHCCTVFLILTYIYLRIRRQI